MTRSRENTRARLLEAAHEVFAEVGLGAASVEAICERAGFTRGAFYSNFETKDELFLALMVHLAEQQLDQVAQRVKDLDASTDPADLVAQITDMSLGASMEPQLLSEIRTQALRDPALADAYLAWTDRMCERVEAIIVEVTGSRGLRLRMPARDAAQVLLDLSGQSALVSALERKTDAEASRALQQTLTQIVGLIVATD